MWVEDAGASGKSMSRPGIQAALAALGRREASVLVVAKLDRLSRSVQDFAATMATAQKQGWALVALDLGVDTTTPAGELIANVMASVAQWERRIIGARTRDALAERKAAGVRLGRERMASGEVVARIVAASSAGHTVAAIARALDADAVPTPFGGLRWYPSTVARIVAAEKRRLAA